MSQATTALPARIEDKPRPAPLVINSRGGGVQITSIEDLYRFGKYIVVSGLAPRDFTTPEKVIVAVQWGFEIGLTPLQALNSIAVIGQRPSLWGDALPGLVQASGKCEYIHEHFEGEGDGLAAVCESKRRDQSQPVVTRFSVHDAKKAKLWDKQGPWSQYPTRMLKMRARAFNLRDTFADVLRGIGVAEEVQDYADTRPTPQTQPQTTAVEAVECRDELLDGALGKTKGTEAAPQTQGEQQPFADDLGTDVPWTPSDEEKEAMRRAEQD